MEVVCIRFVGFANLTEGTVINNHCFLEELHNHLNTVCHVGNGIIYLAHNFIDTINGLEGLVCQRADFRGYNGKASSSFTGSCCLNICV